MPENGAIRMGSKGTIVFLCDEVKLICPVVPYTEKGLGADCMLRLIGLDGTNVGASGLALKVDLKVD